MRGYEEDELIDGLKLILEYETELDRRKECLAKYPEFNLEDAFRLFDFSSMGSVSVADL